MSVSIESQWIAVGGAAIELLAALVVAFHACWALVAIVQHYEADRPRLIIADGVLAALGFSVAGTLLKALALQSWRQIGMFAFVLALRTLLKQVFKRERKQMAKRVPVP
jgi:Ca2+/Na+ antiporter